MTRWADTARQRDRKRPVSCTQICDARPGFCLEPPGEALYLVSRRAMNEWQIRQPGGRENDDARERQKPTNDPRSQSTQHGSPGDAAHDPEDRPIRA